MQTITLSESALSLLRRRLAGDDEVTETNRAAYRELVAAGIMFPISTWAGGPESVFRFTEEGWARRKDPQKVTQRLAGAWRERMGIEPTKSRSHDPSPVLKTGQSTSY